MAGEKIIEKPEPGATGLKLESVTDLGELEVATGKNEISSNSTSSIPSLANANSCSKGSNGSFTQSNDSYNLHADGSHTGMQSENGSLVYYLPGYNPYTSGTLVGADGQCAGQQQYFPSSGYLQPPVSYGSEAVPCYSWDPTFVGDLPNVTAAGFANAKCAPGSTAFAKSNGFYSMKTNGNPASKFSSSTAHAQPIRTINKVPRVGSDFSRGILKDYHPIGKFPPFTYQKQGLLPHDGQANYRPIGREWNLNDRYKSRDKYNRNVNFETLTEVTRGPRAYAKTVPLGSSSTNEKEELGFSVRRDRYNLQDFQTDYETAKFYIIKSYSEDDIHKSIKYDVWSSTPNGNKKLDAKFRDVEGKASEKSNRCPVFLFFSVNGSGQFVGIAEMVGQVDFNKDMEFWQLDKWNGFFPVKWHIIKDVPNSQLRHIILENNDNRPVTFTRDTQEIGLNQGLEMLRIFKSYAAKTSLLDDFNFYENRAKSIHSQSSKPSSQQNEIYSNGDIPEAFHKFIGQPVSIFCSSRTDAGVHALSNVCHVDIQRISKRKPGEVLPPHEPTVVRRAVNHFLQKNEGDIMVIDVRCVPADFHARFKAQERTYFYRLLSGPEPLSTFERDRAWHVTEELDILAMQEACQVLVGHHDFSSFRAAGCQAKSPIRTLDELEVSEVVSTPYFPSVVEGRQNNLTMEDLHASSNKSDSDLPVSSISINDGAGRFNGEGSLGFGIRRRHCCFVVTARARSFLYHQVRLLVGVLKAVGTGNLTISDVERILNAKSVTAASPMAPACGLYLGHVKYDLP